MFQAYNVKTKQKNVDIHDAVITKTAKGAYMVQGHVEGSDQRLTTLVSKSSAKEGLEKGWGKPGWTDDTQAAIAELTPIEKDGTNYDGVL